MCKIFVTRSGHLVLVESDRVDLSVGYILGRLLVKIESGQVHVPLNKPVTENH